ncbi:MAG TPA: hypothetical protein VF690_16760, partial [Hymenobacter sp.]
MASAAEALHWINQLRVQDEHGKKCLCTLRWLVHAELERSTPSPPKSITHFTPDDLTSGPL